MEIHQLRYFVEVVRTSGFTRAAERCHVTQPTLSQQVRKLEEMLGEPLLQRRRDGVILTSFGKTFYERALAILAEVRAAQEEAAAFRGELKGSLHLGMIPTVAPYLTPRMLKDSLSRFPQITFRITEDTTDNLMQAMRKGTVDLSLLSLPLPGDEWVAAELMRDEILVALPKNHALGGKPRVNLQRLAGEPLVLMQEAHCLRGQSLSLCSQAGWQPEVFFYSSQIDTLLAMVEAGLGISFIPAMARPYMGRRQVKLRSLAKGGAFRTIALVRHRQSSPTRALQRFWDTCLATFAKD
ncbi:LysR family transcriptional regulator [Opitutaceae bacterium TAV5]|nr:LysR family transcriptional regulator [Opitutaceae bacterium TAV5]